MVVFIDGLIILTVLWLFRYFTKFETKNTVNIMLPRYREPLFVYPSSGIIKIEAL